MDYTVSLQPTELHYEIEQLGTQGREVLSVYLYVYDDDFDLPEAEM